MCSSYLCVQHLSDKSNVMNNNRKNLLTRLQPNSGTAFHMTACISDINECNSNGGLGPCQHICTNTNGSFNCSCHSGYTLSGLNCTGKDYAPQHYRMIHETHLLLVGAVLINSIGSFYCSFLGGYNFSYHCNGMEI